MRAHLHNYAQKGGICRVRCLEVNLDPPRTHRVIDKFYFLRGPQHSNDAMRNFINANKTCVFCHKLCFPAFENSSNAFPAPAHNFECCRGSPRASERPESSKNVEKSDVFGQRGGRVGNGLCNGDLEAKTSPPARTCPWACAPEPRLARVSGCLVV